MLGAIRGEVRFKESMSFHTGLRIGGPADIFVIPSDLADLQRTLAFAARDELQVTVIGAGRPSGIVSTSRSAKGRWVWCGARGTRAAVGV